jgi:anti-sigma regulatory factor (Ser/Thr protein kinase)
MRFLLLLLSLLSLNAFAQTSEPPPPLAARAWLLMDQTTGQILAASNPEMKVEPASLTKIMTSYVVYGALRDGKLKLDQIVPVSEKAWKAPGSRMFIAPDQQVTVDALLSGMVVQSGNDASIALAEAVAGSEEAFANLMNAEAKRLGLTNTHFVNATGLPDSAQVAVDWPDTSELPTLRTDEEKLRTILRNLLENACKYTARGTISVAARWNRRSDEIEIDVSDTGVGIEPGEIEAIFEAFRQGGNRGERATAGVGLGLYIVQRLTSRLGGEVEVRAAPGRGSTFTVRVPRLLHRGDAVAVSTPVGLAM